MRGSATFSRRHEMVVLAAGVSVGCTGKVVEPAPTARYNATARLNADGKVLHLVGGADRSGLLNDAWVLDIPHRQWVQVNGPPTPILSGCSARVDDEIWVFGGSRSAREESDRLSTWETLGGRWFEEDSGSVRPEARREATLTRVGDGQALLFGGNTDDAADPGETFGDVWGLDRQGPTWTEVATTDGPIGRQRHAAVQDGSRLWIHGGVDPSGAALAELWSLDLTTWVWTNHTVLDTGPAARADHLLGYHDDRLIVWGGAIDDPLVWVYDITDAEWTAHDAGGPTTRDAFAWDQVDGEPWMVLVGGDPVASDDYATDVWFLELDAIVWTEAKRLDGSAF